MPESVGPSRPRPTRTGQTSFRLRLGQAYYYQGFINVPVAFSDQLGEHGVSIDIHLGQSQTVPARINRTANPNRTPRIMGGKVMKEWIQTHHAFGDIIEVTILSSSHIEIR